ncbi:MAG: hypothetical protein LBF37_04085 [Rickettsiales bacterium]|nr:hypothetical protein [Rickettsiales bacterium]
MDINGVILNDVKLSVILHAMQEYGHAKALYLLACWKLKDVVKKYKGRKILGVSMNEKWQQLHQISEKYIMPIAAKQAPRAYFCHNQNAP